jgi:hypothetical protein
MSTQVIKDYVTTSVIEDLQSRSDVGIKKYGTTIHQNNKDNFLNHLYEELLDAAQYCKKLRMQSQDIQDLVRSQPNDAELGKLIREKYS